MKLCLPFFLLLSWSLAEATSQVYVSEKFRVHDARIVVALHGCMQNAESMALGSGWNAIADRENLVVIYPQVPSGSNPVDCWSWYEVDNQRPDQGQLKLIHDEIERWKLHLGLRHAPVMVTGISSGAAMVAGLLACYPLDYAAGAIHSGPSYGLAASSREAQKVLRDGPAPNQPRTGPCDPGLYEKPVLVLQGTKDPVVNPNHVDRLIKDFMGVAEPVTPQPKKSKDLNYSVVDYKMGRKLRGRVILIEGLGHAWAGFDENLRHPALVGPESKAPTQVPFFTAQGPSSTNLIWEFFSMVGM